MEKALCSVEVQNKITRKKAFNLSNTEALRKLVSGQVHRTIHRYYPNCNIPINDVAWDCFVTLHMRGFFYKYDFTQSQKLTYLWNGVKNYLIDQERRANSRIKYVSYSELQRSMNEKYGGTEAHISRKYGEVNMLDIEMSNNSFLSGSYLEILDLISADKKNGAPIAEFPNLGKLVLSSYSVIFLAVSGYLYDEMAQKYGVTIQSIKHLYDEGIIKLRQRIKDVTWDFDKPDLQSLSLANAG